MKSFKKVLENKEADKLYTLKLDLISWWKENSSKPNVIKKRKNIQGKIDQVVKLLDEVVDETYEK